MCPSSKEEPARPPETGNFVSPPDIDELIFGGDITQRHSER